METMGVSRHLVQLLSNLYRDQQAAVRVEEDLTEWFEVKKGVRQGCLLSPMCFNFYSEAVMRESVEEQPTIGVNISGRNINNLRFADDIALIATSPEGLHELLDSTDSTSSEYQLEISTKKTKVMAVAKEPTQVTATCRGEQLQQVPRFKYLGSTLEHTASCSHEINIRLGAARAAL
ncbi:Hypp2117 [Branchiostoma lanceolatum]|uniref:Hypp2117 protein n=1 Tax=Branchiostoma lanceolatum TaxID=7740 RepID=A0A8K0ENX7_BRALA|nr:Hypp2117 [Branchiostoma lanceolatum]